MAASILKATVVFVDIVDYSKRNSELQHQLIQSLNAAVNYELYELLNDLGRKLQVVVLPTGDGMAISLLHKNEADVVHDQEKRRLKSLLLRMQQWTRDGATRQND